MTGPSGPGARCGARSQPGPGGRVRPRPRPRGAIDFALAVPSACKHSAAGLLVGALSERRQGCLCLFAAVVGHVRCVQL